MGDRGPGRLSEAVMQDDFEDQGLGRLLHGD